MEKRRSTRWKRAAAGICAAALLSGCAGSDSAGVEASKPDKVSYKADDYESWNRLMEENRTSQSFREALGQFTFQSGSRVLKDSRGNVNYSPLSLYYAMAIAACGAEGETAGQLLDSLGVQDQDQLSEQCRKLYQWFDYERQRQESSNKAYGEDNNSKVQLGNSLWASDQLKLREDYRKMAAAQFFASSYQVDFTSQEAGEQIGSWILDQTNGVLHPNPQLDPETMMVILNTLYFYGGWKDTFNPADTSDDSFNMADGGQVICPFMNRVESTGSFRSGDGYTVSALYTVNGCSMVFLLPDQGRSVEEFLDTPDRLEAAMDMDYQKWQNGKVTWKVPKFSFGSSLGLSGLLKDMGMENMFLPDADFGRISEQPLYVSDVLQETHIAIDEDGVEGAAYTMIVETGGIPMEEELTADMILDRPFIYGIQDYSTGVWLFLGVCRNPAAG